MSIVDLLGVGKERAVTRAELCAITGLPDRAVRRQIAEAREHGFTIVNFGDGYYISDDLYELRRQFNMNRARAMSILRKQKYLKRKITDAENAGQLTIDGGGGDG